ncbi:MAG: TlpA family protein disulfide reductase [Tamlana sp.]
MKYSQDLYMKLYFSFLLIAITLLGCKQDAKEVDSNYAYVGGEIINPNTNFVVLYKDETVIDTVKLDGRNRFLYKIDNLNEGFYSFRHGGEYQMILLEPKDSILFRLNTLDFDESLVFTGEGDKKNNYLINDFLESEKEKKYIFQLCQLNPSNYQKHIDSINAIKLNGLETFKSKYKISPLFEKIAKSNIDFSYYSNKEVYPFIHYGKNKAAILNSLPKDFYDYRKDVNYNDTFFSNYYYYNTFLRNVFNNLSLKFHDEHSKEDVFDWNSICYNLDRLHLIDSLVTNTTIKDELLYNYTIGYLTKSQNIENNDAILKSYLDKSENEKGKIMMHRINQSLKNLKEGSKLPKITVLDYNNNEFDINSIFKNPTVICFWTQSYYDHFNDSHKKIKELMVKYPEIDFISINIDDYPIDKPKTILLNHGYSIENEYKFKYPKDAMEMLAIYPLTKTIVVDKNKKIVTNNTNIFSIHFEEELLGLLNK